ncbi:ESAT-6 like protein ESXI [Mycobacterium tuberculosis]|nr:ESAT-6 like protein ESXI [Mycobacterium tuberculosis]
MLLGGFFGAGQCCSGSGEDLEAQVAPSFDPFVVLFGEDGSAIISDVLTASDFWGGAGSAACQGFITQLGRNFQVIYEQANAHGQKVQAAGNNMAQTDSAVGSSWA